MEILHSWGEDHKILHKNINDMWAAKNKKESDCANTGDKLQYVCRRYRVLESELCIPVSLAQMAKEEKELQDNFIAH